MGDYYGEYKITKFKCNGETAWQYNKPIPVPNPNGIDARMVSIQADSLGNVFGAGVIYMDSLGLVELTTRLDSNGDFIWEHSVKFENFETAHPEHGITLNDGRFIITGPVVTNSDSNHYQYFLALYDTEGIKWAGVTILPGFKNYSNALCQDGNSIYVAGVSFFDPPAEQSHFISKYSLSELVNGAGSPFSSVSVRPVYPSPFHDVLNMDIPIQSGVCRLTLADDMGKIVLTHNCALVDGKIRVEQLAGLPRGMYTVTVTADGQVFVGRAVKP